MRVSLILFISPIGSVVVTLTLQEVLSQVAVGQAVWIVVWIVEIAPEREADFLCVGEQTPGRRGALGVVTLGRPGC